MTILPREGWVHRAPRPLIGWSGVLLVAICLLFLVGLAAIVMFAMWRWANGLPIDLMGFAAVLAQATAAGAAVWSLVKKFMGDRSLERQAQIGVGTAAPPFDSLPPGGGAPAQPDVTFRGDTQ